MTKREKIEKIIINDCGGWSGSQELFEKVVNIIYDKLKDVEDSYMELLLEYIRL